LYSVTVGELGCDVPTLETNLRNLLELSARWNAITLLDEADIFMQKRQDADIERNGFVGIFLRLLEYHRGILFLTTNRVECFDDAFQSRISLSLTYKPLNKVARVKIWNTFLTRAGAQDISAEEFAMWEMNGREIRGLVRLATALMVAGKDERLSTDHINRVLQIQQGRFRLLTEGSS